MKYNLVTWTAESQKGENFSGNASLQWEGDVPSEEVIIENLKASDPRLKDCHVTLQDKLEFDTKEEMEQYGNQ